MFVLCVSTGNGKMHSVLTPSFVDTTSENADKSTVGVAFNISVEVGVFDELMMEHLAVILHTLLVQFSTASNEHGNYVDDE